MAELTLTPKERQRFKGEAHRLNPVVLLGAEGLTDAVVKEIDRALNSHGLIKIRVPGDEREERETIFSEVAERLSAARVQAIGKVIVLYRPLPDNKEDSAASNSGARSPKAPARTPKKAAAGSGAAQRGKLGRSDIRSVKSAAPRRAGGRQR